VLVSQHCVVTFAIGQFKDTLLCDVSPLDCSDLLQGIPYQTQRNAIYMAKSRQYKITKDGHTYILTVKTPKPPTTKEKTPHVHLIQCVSLSLVRPVQPNNDTHPIPDEMTPCSKNSLMYSNPPWAFPHLDTLTIRLASFQALHYLMHPLTT